MDINFELYKVFYHVATSLSFSEASKKLYISQSAVSQSIKTLEKRLGQDLFIRSTKKVRLTAAGSLLLKHIEPAINLIIRGENQLLDATAIGMEQLHIAASDTICRYILVPYFKQFHEKYPNVPIKVTNATSIACVELLEQQKVDLIVTNSPDLHLHSGFITKEILSFQDHFVGNPLYFPSLDSPVSLSELSRYPLMTLDRNSTTIEFLHQLYLQNQLELLPQIELSSNDLLIDLARIGLGIAFVPDYCLKNERELISLPVTDTIPARQIVVSVNAGNTPTAATEAFLSLLPSMH